MALVGDWTASEALAKLDPEDVEAIAESMLIGPDEVRVRIRRAHPAAPLREIFREWPSLARELNNTTVAAALRLGLVEPIAEVTGCDARTVAWVLESNSPRARVQNVFAAHWPGHAKSGDAMAVGSSAIAEATVADVRRYDLYEEVVRYSGKTIRSVRRRIEEARGNSLIRNLFESAPPDRPRVEPPEDTVRSRPERAAAPSSTAEDARGSSNAQARKNPRERETPTTTAVDVFFSYSHRDELHRDELAAHLKLLERSGVIRGWHDRRINAGEDWKHAIDDNLDRARVVLLLVSADFLASDYCFDVEMKRALERQTAGHAIVIPIIVRDCDWKWAPFANSQALPKDAKPVTSWQNRDEAWNNVAQGIRARVERLTRV